MNTTKKIMAFWATMIASNLCVAVWLVYSGVFGWVVSHDFTYISVMIMALYVGCLVSLPFTEFDWSKSNTRRFDTHYYISSRLTQLGLLGTVIGLMVAVDGLSQLTIDVNNQSAIMGMIKLMFSALGTALVTTIVGLIASMALATQLVLLDRIFKNAKS